MDKIQTLKEIIIKKRGYFLMAVGAILFFVGSFLISKILGLVGWLVFIVGIVEYFRGYR